jgi:hypothetical protein
MASSARDNLHAKLSEPAREAYWGAFSRFLRFEIPKAEFDTVALEALGPHVALHNELILALLHEAQSGPPPPPPERMEIEVATMPPMLQQHDVHGVQPGHMLGGNDAAATTAAEQGIGSSEAASAAAPAAPKLMLKIGRAGDGNLAVSTQRPDLVVDPAEEEQLNALHDRLLDLSRQNGLEKVQPEAVAFMQRAVRAVSNRLIVAAVLNDAGATNGATRHVTADDLHEVIRQPTPSAPWMAPLSQRAGYMLGAFNKFVS